MSNYVLEFVDRRCALGEHSEKVFVVHWAVQTFEHATDLGDDSSVRVNPSSFVDAF